VVLKEATRSGVGLAASARFLFVGHPPAIALKDHAVIYVDVQRQPDEASETCVDPGGVTLAVAGHDETIALYPGDGTSTTAAVDAQRVAVYLATTGTSSAPEMLTVVGTKAGCTARQHPSTSTAR